ncbi:MULTISPECIES: DUF2894 domain-containing protein [unclassified Acidovorax]|jgi:hypothetical protein|uniref:DUF2894 domain-containing protein n=1 Tax=unclassified Acidovorax TaxID=2684926 RepID=UPI000B3F81CA|nr:MULTISPECIES: DUF2894 domain-containing protein [unclassified Acidovorax]MBU4424536.1 DUF2894 domain-containing protein [Gammaproteobacteria bacterium]
MSEPSEPTLGSLRADGADRHDPARFHFLEVLARRLPGQPVAVRQVLEGRLHAAVADYAERARSSPDAAQQVGRPAIPAAISPLVQLNRDLSARAQADADVVRAGDGGSLSDMKSVRQFSEVWSKISAQRQVAQALDRGPENAGPLNSHRLMLRSLSLMQSLSPDYLRRFLSQVDSLLWLEQASAKPLRSTAKPGRKSRPRP